MRKLRVAQAAQPKEAPTAWLKPCVYTWMCVLIHVVDAGDAVRWEALSSAGSGALQQKRAGEPLQVACKRAKSSPNLSRTPLTADPVEEIPLFSESLCQLQWQCCHSCWLGNVSKIACKDFSFSQSACPRDMMHSIPSRTSSRLVSIY